MRAQNVESDEERLERRREKQPNRVLKLIKDVFIFCLVIIMMIALWIFFIGACTAIVKLAWSIIQRVWRLW